MLHCETASAGFIEVAASATLAEFRAHVIQWFMSQLGCDGLVHGDGARLYGSVIAITRAEVVDRPPAFLTDYVAVRHLDSVGQRFASCPGLLQNIAVEAHYREARLGRVADYLRHYRVAHLLLGGVENEVDHGLSWMTLYREDTRRPFTAAQADACSRLLPLVMKLDRGLQPSSGGEHAPGLLALQTPAAAHGLTPREVAVALAYASGSSCKAVARCLDVSPGTVKAHLHAAFRKLGVHNKVELHHKLLGEAPGGTSRPRPSLVGAGE
ncbi:LuxR C-terminal-related transcriptional regulator [Aquabacterium sp. A7-Y]|uniref:response regulator transcription factor n=1 Tax=Aquabacterium sp. A7-Y TaxID=1349605 RepID=UPI00223E199F|nr:LuxR C-terminal-related transcriptional regulator [Aquabacterium sp. A7-Y]MCW7537356.1 LuxR C-terminal-related transcriptional regulator [Aquabacterium sp. A7-Y]